LQDAHQRAYRALTQTVYVCASHRKVTSIVSEYNCDFVVTSTTVLDGV